MHEESLQEVSLPLNAQPVSGIDSLFEKGTGLLNEDAQLIGDQIYGVFDGATSLNGAVFDGLTGGYLASKIGVEIFSQDDRPLTELAALTNTAIFEEMAGCGVNVDRKEELWSTSTAVVRMHGDTIEWCQAGDCRIQLIFTDGSSRQLVEPPDHDAETLALWQKMAPISQDPIHVALADKILEVRRRMNIDYGVLNGESEALKFIRSGVESLTEVAAVLLYTDGLYVPDPASGRSHSQEILSRLFTLGGLEAVRNHIRTLQESDPDCLIYPRFKISDDISAIALYQ